MKEKATIYDFTRLCKNTQSCDICPIEAIRKSSNSCFEEMIDNTEKVNEIILNWCKEHPVKTRQDEFLEMFPNVPTNNKIIDICPKTVDKGYSEGYCNGEYCEDCRKSYWLEEVEDDE